MRQALIVLKALAGNDEVKHEIAKLGGIELIVAVINKYQNNARVAEAACRLLTTITLRNADNCRQIVQCQGHEHIVQIMKLHPQDIDVQVRIFILSCISLLDVSVLKWWLCVHGVMGSDSGCDVWFTSAFCLRSLEIII